MRISLSEIFGEMGIDEVNRASIGWHKIPSSFAKL
jgi:hypothetical protein